MRVSRGTFGVAACALALSSSVRAQETRAQANAALVTGLAFERRDDERHRPLTFLLHGDVLLGRRDNRSWGGGPMARVGTYAFRDLQAQAGVSVLLPTHEYLPFVLSAGPMVRKGDKTSPGGFASLFWGSRSFNHHGSYVLAGGLVLEARRDFGGEKSNAVLVGLHLDGEVLILPLLAAINLFR